MHELGYGVRAIGYPSSDQLFPGQLSALAVPIFVGDNVLACLSLIWVVNMASLQQIVETRLGQLQKTALSLGKAFAQQGYTQPLWLDARFSQRG